MGTSPGLLNIHDVLGKNMAILTLLNKINDYFSFK
jgi:hypothetical protein